MLGRKGNWGYNYDGGASGLITVVEVAGVIFKVSVSNPSFFPHFGQ
jgi:hypothetical protein